MSDQIAPISVLFVCMGNICRSPAAECLMRSALETQGLKHNFAIDSAGTGGWHVGSKPDRRMRAAAKSAGHSIDGSARQVCKEDFTDFDWIFCMDYENYENLISMGANPGKTHLLLEFIEHQSVCEVPDPYYGGDDGFKDVIALVDGAVHSLINRLLPTTS
jgi:protein-tyrosine phosphatase